MKRYVRNYLFAEPSIVEGVSRIIDIGSTLQVYNDSDSIEEADLKALSNDWLAIGEDIRSAIKKYDRKVKIAA